MQKVYVIEAMRTPVGRYGGSLSSIRPDDMLAKTIAAILKRNTNIELSEIEDVIAGDANQAGEDNRNVARMAALLAGLPESVAGNTVNRLCASGLQAVMDASRAIMCGDGAIFLAGGVESMSRAPYVISKADGAFSRKTEMFDTTIGWRFSNPELAKKYYPFTMGETAENVAKQWQI
ncbi:MAG: 3-oxoadipyl-CoA thiolase, partial [Bacteroidetes bacterium]|nr:3-oxoadipyl-CoA thiolase [Bacteroidota bacterium]